MLETLRADFGDRVVDRVGNDAGRRDMACPLSTKSTSAGQNLTGEGGKDMACPLSTRRLLTVENTTSGPNVRKDMACPLSDGSRRTVGVGGKSRHNKCYNKQSCTTGTGVEEEGTQSEQRNSKQTCTTGTDAEAVGLHGDGRAMAAQDGHGSDIPPKSARARSTERCTDPRRSAARAPMREVLNDLRSMPRARRTERSQGVAKWYTFAELRRNKTCYHLTFHTNRRGGRQTQLTHEQIGVTGDNHSIQ